MPDLPRVFDYESKSQDLVPARQFFGRLLASFGLALLVTVVSLLVGMWGYCSLEGMSAIDGFLNAAMILSGMGPMAVPETTGAKIFSGCYAIYSGLMLVMSAGVVFAPLVHRFLHKLHADEDDVRERSKRNAKEKP